MEKLTKREYEILELIRQGKSKSEILTTTKTSLKFLAQYLTRIFKKTDYLVAYHTERSKFEELQAYCRNNPTAFTIFPNENSEQMSTNSSLEKERNKIELDIVSVLSDLNLKYDTEKYNAQIKLQVIDDIKKKLKEINPSKF